MCIYQFKVAILFTSSSEKPIHNDHFTIVAHIDIHPATLKNAPIPYTTINRILYCCS